MTDLKALRQEIECDYRVVDGGIITPGKFQGEALYAVAVYYTARLGFIEQIGWPDETSTDLLEIDQDWRDAFPEIHADTYAIVGDEDNNGFYCIRELTEAQLKDLNEANKNAWHDDGYPVG